MKVAILSQYFDPEPIVKLKSLTCKLLDAGHEVAVLTAIPNHPHGAFYAGYRGAIVQKDKRLGVAITRTYVWPYRGNVTWRRMVNYSSFALSALLGAPLLGSFDVLYVYHPPLTIGLPAFLIARLARKPFIYDVQDIWPEAGISAGAITPGPLFRLMATLAQWIYRAASAITVIAPEFRDILIDQGVPSAKIRVIPNWANDDLYYPRNADGVRSRYGLPVDAFLVMYAGNMGSTHGVEHLLYAAKHLAQKREIYIVLVGSGPEHEKLINLQCALGLTNVTFLGHKPHEEMPDLLAAADLLVVLMRRSHLGAVSLPSRMLAYMACGRPMLVAGEGAPRSLVQRHACGVACEPESPDQIAESIANLATQPELLKRMGSNGRQAYLAEYCEETVTRRLVGIIEELAASRK